MERPSKLRALVEKLVGARHDYKEGVYSFEKLDIPRLKRELALERLGAENGRANQPATSSEELDEVEHRISNRIQAERDEAHQRATDALATLNERLVATSLEGRAIDIKVEIDRQIADFTSTVHDGENRLHLARRALLDAERSLTYFRARSGIQRPAEYPESHWWAFGIITSIVAFESVLNGIFLADAQAFGIAGGIAIALMISLVNVAFGFALGRWGLCGLLHKRITVKAGALLLVLVLLCALTICNLAAAHYRAALLGGNYKTPEMQAFASLVSNPVGITDLKSWLLFVFGVVSATVAGFKGYDWDDPYPGYGRRDRAYKRVVRDYEDEMRDVMVEIDAIKDDAVEAAQTLKREIDVRRNERGRISGHRQRLATNFNEHMKHLEGALGELVGTYRRANVRARTETAPSRFDKPVLFSRSSLILPDDLDARKAENEYGRIVSTLDEAINKLLAEHDRAHQRFQSIKNLTYEEVAGGIEPKARAAE